MKRKAVFLDRDGVIIRQVHHLHRLDQIRILPKAGESIKLLRKYKFLVIVISNQSMIGRGLMTEKDFEKISREIKRRLQKKGSVWDGLYCCPHHPEAKIAQYKKRCPDRKPNIGMIKKAEQDFNIDLEKSWIIGDMTSDIKTGENAGLKTILLKTGYGGKDGRCNVKPNYICRNLWEAAGVITAGRRINKSTHQHSNKYPIANIQCPISNYQCESE